MVQEGANTPVVMRLRVSLPGIKPAPWRWIEVLASTTLAGLHEVIQAAMGWEDLHLHCFRILGRRYDSEYADMTRVFLADLRLRAGERFTYTYNHLAGWEHELRIEAIAPGQPRCHYPRCVGGQHPCPPEWCSGPEALDEIKFVQAHDDRPRRRLLDVLAAQGYAPNQKLVLMSDGGESVRRLVARIGPEAEHVLDWFHVTMRLTVLRQMTKGACPADPGWTEGRLRDGERLKWLLWHGHARQAVDAAQELADDAWGRGEDAKEERTEAVETRGKLARLHAAAEELATYLRRNAGQIVNYGERHRAGERISTGFVESAVNQVVSKRFSKRHSMCWTQAGAHLALQARTRVLNGELENTFRRRWPGFQPSPKAEPDEAKNDSFAAPPPSAVTAPVAHSL